VCPNGRAISAEEASVEPESFTFREQPRKPFGILLPIVRMHRILNSQSSQLIKRMAGERAIRLVGQNDSPVDVELGSADSCLRDDGRRARFTGQNHIVGSFAITNTDEGNYNAVNHVIDRAIQSNAHDKS
jgi:hypothetical protein